MDIIHILYIKIALFSISNQNLYAEDNDSLASPFHVVFDIQQQNNVMFSSRPGAD